MEFFLLKAVGSLDRHISQFKITWKRKTAAYFLGPVWHAVREIFVAAAQEIWISSSVLHSASPSSQSSLCTGRCLEMDSPSVWFCHNFANGLLTLVSAATLPNDTIPDGFWRGPSCISCRQLPRGNTPPSLLPGWVANIHFCLEHTSQKRKFPFFLPGCEAWNLCLFSAFFQCLIIAKHAI